MQHHPLATTILNHIHDNIEHHGRGPTNLSRLSAVAYDLLDWKWRVKRNRDTITDKKEYVENEEVLGVLRALLAENAAELERERGLAQRRAEEQYRAELDAWSADIYEEGAWEEEEGAWEEEEGAETEQS